MSRPRSRRTSRDSPASTTRCTPGTVRDDSASAVETTIRGGSPGRRPPVARSCWAAGSRPWSGRTSTPSTSPCRRATVSSTSRAPGTKTSASQPSSRCARAAVRARWSRNSRVTPRASRRGDGEGACSVRRGCRALGTSTIAAPSSTSATARASSVADIAPTSRSSRSCRVSASIPSSRSVSRERSWTSSSTTAETPGSSGSARRRRSSTPGVSISTAVPFPTVRSPRTVKPTGPPSGLPSREARRRAAARTATRRGWVTRVSPPTRFATRGGTSVVLPVPGGAVTTIAPVRAAAPSSSRAAATGSPAPTTSRSKRCRAGERSVMPPSSPVRRSRLSR